MWAEAVETTCYVLNRVSVRPRTNKTPFEVFYSNKSSVKHLRIFGSKCLMLNDNDELDKYDSRRYEGIFRRYLESSKTYRVFLLRTQVIEKSSNVKIDDEIPRYLVEDDEKGFI